MNLPLAAALLGVAAEWLALGWLSGIRWPGQPPPRTPWPVVVALALPVGAFVTALSMLLVALVGLPITNVALVVAVGAALAGLVRLTGSLAGSWPRVAVRWHFWGRGDHRPPPGQRGPDSPASNPPAAETRSDIGWPEAAGWVVLAGLLGAILVRSWVIPEVGWDAYSHWGLKAKLYFLTGRIENAYTAHEYYPPLVPLLETWLYVHRGEALIDEAKLVWALLGTAFSVCLAWHLRLALARPARWLAPYAAGTTVLATMQLLENFWTGQADLALTAFFCLSVLALFQALRDARPASRRGWLRQAGLFAGAAALAKYEGLFRLAVVVAALGAEGLFSGSWRQRFQEAVVYGGAALLAFAPWALFRNVNDIGVTNEHTARLQLDATGLVLRALAETLAGVRTGGGLAVVLIALAVTWPWPVRRPLRFLTLVFSGELVATLLAFLWTSAPPDRQVYLSATRLLMQFLPLALFAVALALAAVLVPEQPRSGGTGSRLYNHAPGTVRR